MRVKSADLKNKFLFYSFAAFSSLSRRERPLLAGNLAPSFCIKTTHNPQFPDSLRRRANVRNVSFRISLLRWPIDRRSILNHQQLSTTSPVSFHFNQAGHSINDVHLIPIELIHSKRDSVRKAREAHLINKAKTLHPFGINKRDEARQ